MFGATACPSRSGPKQQNFDPDRTLDGVTGDIFRFFPTRAAPGTGFSNGILRELT